MSAFTKGGGSSGALDTAFRVKLILSFAAVYLIWGSTYLAIRFAVETMPPFLMAGTRFLVAGGILYAFARSRGAAAPSGSHWKSAFIIGGFLLLGGNGSVVWAEQTVPSGLTALLIATEPLWVVILASFGRDAIRPTRSVVLGLAIGFAGVGILVGPGLLPGGEGVRPIGALVLVLDSASWAHGSLLARKLPAASSPVLVAGMQMVAGGALLTLTGLVTGETSRLDPGAFSTRSILALVYLAVFGSLVAFSAYSWLVRNVAPSRAATYAFVNPVVAVLLGWALAGEVITGRTALAAAVIIGGVVLIIRQQPGRPKKSSTRASSPTDRSGGASPRAGAESIPSCQREEPLPQSCTSPAPP